MCSKNINFGQINSLTVVSCKWSYLNYDDVEFRITADHIAEADYFKVTLQ